MNEQNLKYLKDNIKYMGFGENMNHSFRKQSKRASWIFNCIIKLR